MRWRSYAIAFALAVGATGSVALASPAAADQNHAVVVIDSAGGSRVTTISFSGTISGLQALNLAGGNPVTYGFSGLGVAVCAIDGVGHDATQAACLGTPDDPAFWAYFHASRDDSGWTTSGVGASSSIVHDGDVEGWRYGGGARPAFVSFCSVVGCAPPPTSAPDPAPNPPAAPGATAGAAAAAPTNAETGSSTAGSTATEPADSTEPVTTLPATTLPPTSSSDRAARNAQALGARSRGGSGGGGGSGSPVGVLIAATLVALLVAIAVVNRRLRRSAA